MNEGDIEMALIECLARCRQAPDHRVALSEFVLGLQDLRCWEREAAEEVGRRALRRLRLDGAHSIHEELKGGGTEHPLWQRQRSR